ncbi:MAG: pentapeptide repeat protein [Verrucomicrobiales bacterium]|nr:pentapeptide repeat protein [Verrucomicrobiales bacterium]
MGNEAKRPTSWAEKSESTKGGFRRSFVKVEWWCEWIAYWLSKRAFLKVVEYLGKLTLLVSLILWIYPGIPQRKQAADDSKKSRHYVAWQTLNSAIGKPGNAGRSDALEDLSRDGVPLNGVSLTGGIVLIGAGKSIESSDGKRRFCRWTFPKDKFFWC